MILSFLFFACIVFQTGQSTDQSSTVPTGEYERTLSVLNQYRTLAADDDGAVLNATDEPVQPGDRYPDAPHLIRLLSKLGDLAPEAVSGDAELYQGELVEAVKRFQ